MKLIDYPTGQPKEKEFEAISTFLDRTPAICEYVLRDLNKGKIFKRQTSTCGMTAEQAFRAAVVMRLCGFAYGYLAFHISDSRTLRQFCRIGIADKGFKKSALNENIKKLSPKNWIRISQDLLAQAKDENIEKGRKARIDCTVVASHIPKPLDSFKAEKILARHCSADPQLMGLSCDINHYGELARQVYDQSFPWVVHSESVPADQKVFSIFEDHTDIIIKDRRDTYYGHKICLTGRVSNLIPDCIILEGHPASQLVETMHDRQHQIYGRYPLKVTLVDGFASKDNLVKGMKRKIKVVCFSKKRGSKEADMCRSDYVYQKLRQFRARIESWISWLKRSFGLSCCTWKVFRSFKCYISL